MSFFQKPLTPPPSLLEFSRHFFHFFPKLFNKNFKKIFLTVLSLLAHWHLFAFDCFRANKKCLKTFGLVETPPPLGQKSYLSHLIFTESFPKSCTYKFFTAFFLHSIYSWFNCPPDKTCYNGEKWCVVEWRNKQGDKWTLGVKASQVQGTKAAPSRECGWRGRVGGGSQAVRAMETQVQLESGSWRSKRKI